MSYVSIYKPVNDRITKVSTENSSKEVIGLLIGSLVNDTLVIEDSITGEFSGEPHRVVLHPTTVAKIADDLIKGRLKGNIVGWYHSHTEDGIFFSQTDVDTQKKLQQFSSLTVGMVVDARNGDVGYFRLDSNGKPFRVSEDKVRVFSEKSDAAPIKESPTPPAAKRTALPTLSPLPIRLILGVILIAMVISISVLGVSMLFTKQLPPPAAIYHTQVANSLVGSPISIVANSTGIKNMTLFYARDEESYTALEMISNNTGAFHSIIPGSQVTGNLSYYLEATTDTGTKISTDVYHVLVADFDIYPENQTVTVYRNATNLSFTLLDVISINGFNQGVTISVSGAPRGVNVFSPANGLPGTIINVSLEANSNASLGSFPLYITASYSPSDSQAVQRTAKVIVTVTDFDLTVQPKSLSVLAGTQSEFSINVTTGQGFEAPMTLTVTGLPQGAKMVLMPTNGSALLTVPGTISFAMQTIGVRQGTYTITLTVKASLHAGGYVIHSQEIQLTVR